MTQERLSDLRKVAQSIIDLGTDLGDENAARIILAKYVLELCDEVEKLRINEEALEEACRWIYDHTWSCPLDELDTEDYRITEDEICKACDCKLNRHTCRIFRMDRPDDMLYCWMKVFRAVAERRLNHD